MVSQRIIQNQITNGMSHMHSTECYIGYSNPTSNMNLLSYTSLSLSFCLRPLNRKTKQDYIKSLHLIGRCATVEQWWGLYCRLIRPSTLKPYRELHLFKDGIKAMWEDPQNAKGGKWVIRLRKNKIDRAWENVCLAMLGEQFMVGSEICGVVLSTRFPVRILLLFTP